MIRKVMQTNASVMMTSQAMPTFLAPRFAHVGMAWDVIITEAFVCITFLIMVSRTCPLWGKRRRALRAIAAARLY
jgi:hypothetical protein